MTINSKCRHDYEVVMPDNDEQPYERCKKCRHCYRESVHFFEL